jgi:hypothetical protein
MSKGVPRILISVLYLDIIDDVGILRKDHYDGEKYQRVGVNYVKTLSEIKTFIVNKLLIPHIRNQHSSLKGADCILLIESAL